VHLPRVGVSQLTEFKSITTSQRRRLWDNGNLLWSTERSILIDNSGEISSSEEVSVE
jgi:hypothetical protein